MVAERAFEPPTPTMDTYGDVVTDELVQARGKVAALALNGEGNGRDRTLTDGKIGVGSGGRTHDIQSHSLAFCH